jgi:hypothetical protein
MGNYSKLDKDGALQAFAAEVEMIPVTVSFDIEILVSSSLDSFKITEMIIKRLYKSNYFNVEVGHLDEATYRLASYYSLPEDYGQENPIDFGFDDKENYKISFPIEVNSFIPSFEFETEVHAGNRMFEIKQKSITSNKGEAKDEQIQAQPDDPNVIDENNLDI